MKDMAVKPDGAEEKERAVNRALAILREHFQAGLVLVSNEDQVGTARMFYGFGNGYAQLGMAHAFIKESMDDRGSD